MNTEVIKERRDKVEQEFNSLEEQKAQIEKRQFELRGQHQILSEQLEKYGSKNHKTKKADVIDVTEVEGA